MTLQALREKNIQETKERLKTAIGRDMIIIQSIHTYDELVKVTNRLMEGLREWFGYWLPEVSFSVKDHETFLQIILGEDYASLTKKYGKSFGLDFHDADRQAVVTYAQSIKALYDEKMTIVQYLEELMRETVPHLTKVVGPLIGARLIKCAGSLKHLAELPSSTIQLLGAESAFFAHLRKRNIAPKFGVIFSHQTIVDADKKEKGKVARKLAAQVSIAVKEDYFRK